MKKIKTILVHGTFARHAEWDNCIEMGEEDSVFVRQLRSELKDRDVELTVEPFYWSGDNSHQARRKAALQLNQRINTLEDQDQHPDGLFVIGHSHGGTVSRLAINLDPTDIDPDGVITFGSPFVRFQPRPVRRMMGSLLWVLRASTLSWLVGMIYLATLVDQPGPFALFLTLGGLGAAFGLWLDRVVRRFRDTLMVTQHQLVSDFDPPGRTDTKFLNYHARFDEAGVLLRFWSFPTWIFQTLLATLVNTSFLIVLAGVGAVAYFVFAFLLYDWPVIGDIVLFFGEQVVKPILGGVAQVLGDAPTSDGPPITPTELARWLPAGTLAGGLAIILGLMVLALLVAPIGVFLPWFVRKQNIAFGGEKPVWSISNDINVDRMASARAEMRTTFLPAAWRRREWQHNYYYQDPGLIRELAERLANWGVKASRPWDLEGWLLWLFRFLFQSMIMLFFVVVAFFLTSTFADEARDGEMIDLGPVMSDTPEPEAEAGDPEGGGAPAEDPPDLPPLPEPLPAPDE